MAFPLLLFTLSGVVALIYQVSWTRMLYPAFGMQLSAITAVVATFLAGLGLGSRLFGPMADRTNPWKLYAGLEIGIGLWGLAMPSLTGAAVWVLPSLGSSQLVRVAGAAVLLVVPCMLMGGTFPAFARGYRRESTSLGRDLGLLYALNTIGGAIGCMAALTAC